MPAPTTGNDNVFPPPFFDSAQTPSELVVPSWS
jgi:hypothetical protein